MRRARTTICCRCFARITVASVLALAWLFPARASGQAIPDSLRWSILTAAPPVGAPVIAGPLIVVPLQTGAIAAHRLSDGAQQWTHELAAEKPLTADAERVYVAAGEALHALEASTGTVQWRVPLGGTPTAAPLAHAGWIIAAAAGQLLAIRAADGQVIWRQDVGPVEFRPSLDGELLVVSVIDGQVLALDVETGATRWTSELGSAPAEPLAVAGRVYVGSQDKNFYTLDARSGRILSTHFVGARVVGRAAVDEDLVYFAALDNVLWAVDRGHGAIKWRQGLLYRPAAGPVVIGTRVVVPGRVATLPVFDARTGGRVSHIQFPARLVQLPLVNPGAGQEPFAIAVTGDLENKWNLSLFTPLLVRPLDVQPLTELPGEAVPLPLRQPSSGRRLDRPTYGEPPRVPAAAPRTDSSSARMVVASRTTPSRI